MLASVLLLTSSGGAAGFVVPVAARPRASVVRMQFDEEGGMVQEIAEGGISLEAFRAQQGQAGPTLSDEKAAKLVLPECASASRIPD